MCTANSGSGGIAALFRRLQERANTQPGVTPGGPSTPGPQPIMPAPTQPVNSVRSVGPIAAKRLRGI